MVTHSTLWHSLWLAPIILQTLLAVVMIQRKLHREFPAYFGYTIFNVIGNTVLFWFDHADWVTVQQYKYAEWAHEIGCIVLRFAVIQEIFWVMFRAYPALKRIGTILFRWAAALLLLVAVVVSAYGNSEDIPAIVQGLAIMDRAVAVVQCGLLAFLFLFASYFRLSWRNFVFGVALGLGIFSSVQLATAALRTGQGAGSGLFDLFVMGTYNFCVLIWVIYVYAPERQLVPAVTIPKHDLSTWNYELQRLLQR
jgi:hypothetical protein